MPSGHTVRLYHTTTPSAAGMIVAEGFNAGDFADRPLPNETMFEGDEEPADCWFIIDVPKTEIRPPVSARHGVEAYLPSSCAFEQGDPASGEEFTTFMVMDWDKVNALFTDRTVYTVEHPDACGEAET